jgi:hypothetical protein
MEQQISSAEQWIGHHYTEIFGGAHAIVQIVVLMVIACRIILGFPRRSSRWLLSMTAFIIQTVVGLALGLKGEGDFKANPVL